MSGNEQHSVIAVRVAEHLTAAFGHKTLDDTDLVRAQPANGERLDGAVLREDGQPLRWQPEPEHRVAQRVCRPGQQRPNAVTRGGLSAPRAHVSCRRPGYPPAAARRPRVSGPSRGA